MHKLMKPVNCWLQLRNNTGDSLVQIHFLLICRGAIFIVFSLGGRGDYFFSEIENIKWQPLIFLLMFFSSASALHWILQEKNPTASVSIAA